MRVYPATRVSLNLRALLHIAHKPCQPTRISSIRPLPCEPSFRPIPLALRLYSTNTPNPRHRLVPRTSVGDPESWFQALRDILPSLFKRPSEAGPGDASISVTKSQLGDLARIVLLARERASVDLLAYCGAHKGKWREARQCFMTLISATRQRDVVYSGSNWPSQLQWSNSRSLNEITAAPFIAENNGQMETERDPALGPLKTSRDVIGQVWQSLGNLLVLAANKNDEESQVILSNILPILRYLHERGYVSETIYISYPNGDHALLQQPRHLAKLFQQMYESLFHDGGQPVSPALAANPSMWLEYILWCCVHGHWLMEGASVVREMLQNGHDTQWKLIDSDKGDITAGAGRTISAKVAVSLIDGLLAMAGAANDPPPSQSLPRILNEISMLKKALSRSNMNLGSFSWDAAISRFIDSPAFVSMAMNPQLMEQSLFLAEAFGSETSSQTGPSSPDSSTYLFDASAAVIGFYHRILLVFIRSRNIEGAFRVLARLQDITDENKRISLEHFFNNLNRTLRSKEEKLRFGAGRRDHQETIEVENSFPGVQFPSYFLNLPVGVLAELLDLVTEVGAVEVGKWMIYPKDVHGPLIPPELYSNQIIAPALIRFAAATSDKTLLSSLMSAQTANISEQTLLALCDNRTNTGDFDGALEILDILKEHSVQQWSALDFSRLLKSLVIQIYGTGLSRDLGDQSSQQAALLLQRFLRGDIGQIWKESFNQINTLIGVMSSLDSYLSYLCSSLIARKREHTVDLPTAAFNAILEATAKVWGSWRAKTLYEDWCIDRTDRYLIPHTTLEDDITGPIRSRVVTRFSSSNTQSSAPPPKSLSFSGFIEPDLTSVRIIVQAALGENQTDMPVSTEQDADKPLDKETLSWAAGELGTRFGLSYHDINYELQGNFSPDWHKTADAEELYSRDTLRLWDVITAQHNPWATVTEERLRAFVANKNERQIVFEPQRAAERFLLQNLARDYGLASESPSAYEAATGQVKVYKTSERPTLPPITVDEARTLNMKGLGKPTKSKSILISMPDM